MRIAKDHFGRHYRKKAYFTWNGYNEKREKKKGGGERRRLKSFSHHIKHVRHTKSKQVKHLRHAYFK